MHLSKNEINILQELGKKYMEIATLPIQNEKIELWKSLNRMKMKRPMVVIDQLPTNELNVNGDLTCYINDPVFRTVEFNLRLDIFKWTHFKADMVLDPFIRIPKAISESGYGITPQDEILIADSVNGLASHRYINLLEDESNIEKLVDMTITSGESWIARMSHDELKALFDR